MASYEQKNRPLRIETALGPDALLLTHLSGSEAVSELFEYSMELMAPVDKPVDFGKLLGQPAVAGIDLPGGTRHFHGIINRLAQGGRDEEFITYRAQLVPHFWLWTKRVQSRIFQHLTVPEILKKVLEGMKVEFELQGKFEPRDYCVQYRESDFDFASRLMEEEGIYYFFKHAGDAHTLMVANTSQSHPDLPVAKKLIYETVGGGGREENRIQSWEKVQELRSGKVTLWDHCFELPHKRLESDKTIPDSVKAGKVTHKLNVANADKLEIYDYPGGYAQRFDGIDRSGGDQAADLQKIFQDNKRTVGIRLQEETAQALLIRGVSECTQMLAGFKFTLERHFDADGDYLLTRVEHKAQLGRQYRSTGNDELVYSNKFECMPFAVPFRPQRNTPRPSVRGSQTAVVVGPDGEEIFTDKYGRVKVQFHWDREGKGDADSSCWIRVATIWAGKSYGVIHIPRIGHEVIVDFLEGDPDQPIIIGSVYNADHMPPLDLPKEKMISGMKSSSTPGGKGFNGMVANDSKGKEGLTTHAQFNMDTTVENDKTLTVHNNRKSTIDVDDTESVGSNQKVDIGSNQKLTVGADQTITISGARKISVTGADTQGFSASQSISVTADRAISVSGNDKLTVGGTETIEATGAIKIISPASIELVVGGSSIKLTPGAIDIVSSGPVTVKGSVVKVNS